MKTKELFNRQTFVERHGNTLISAALIFGGMISGLISGLLAGFINPMVGLTVGVIMVCPAIALLIRYESVVKDRTQTVNLFIGDHRYNKFVELSLKYLGYKTEVLVENGRQERDFIILNDKHLVYVSEYGLSLGEIDKACKIAKENDKSLTVIMHYNIATSEAQTVVKQGGIIIHEYDDLYNTLYKTIKTKGGEPIRECLCT